MLKRLVSICAVACVAVSGAKVRRLSVSLDDLQRELDANPEAKKMERILEKLNPKFKRAVETFKRDHQGESEEDVEAWAEKFNEEHREAAKEIRKFVEKAVSRAQQDASEDGQ